MTPASSLGMSALQDVGYAVIMCPALPGFARIMPTIVVNDGGPSGQRKTPDDIAMYVMMINKDA
jgi:hypothetical protein